MSDTDLTPSTPMPPAEYPSFLAITCGCGLMRLLPDGIKVGDEVRLVPCLKCGSTLTGVLTPDGVQA